MANAMAVAITISALSSSFRDENKSTLDARFHRIKPGLLLFLDAITRSAARKRSHAMHGADGIGTELMAQRLDVAVDGAGAGCVDPVPDLFEQLFAGEHRLRAAGQRASRSNSVGVRCTCSPFTVTMRWAGR